MTVTQRKRMNSPHQPTGCWIRAEKRLAIYLRDGFKCAYCDKSLHGAKPEEMALDHLTPKSEGGSNHESNLVLACRSCNCSRGDKPLRLFASKDRVEKIAVRVIMPLRKFKVMALGILQGRMGD